jgi:hypothetical protein
VVKYTVIITSTIVIGMLATNPRIGIYLTYVLPIVLSCLYFDKKLTLIAVIIGGLSLLISRYFRLSAELNPAPSTSFWGSYISIIAGYTLEFVALSLIFIMLARRTRNLLENLVGSEEKASLLGRIKEVMTRSSKASVRLLILCIILCV